MNVQLYAYDKTTRYELDLYPEQPIKITLSAEEITDPTQINSNFSRQFRIPATNNNSRFFKYWYTSGVIDFDVTAKVTAEIHVDGILYTVGQLRLVAAYDNGTSDRIDFEVVFLGETKTFSSQVGDGYMNSLDCIDAAHVLTLPVLENSWLEVWSPTVSYVTGDYVWWSAAIYNDPLIGDTYVATANNTNSEPTIGGANWSRVTTSQRVPNPEPVRYVLADRGYNYNGDTGAQLPVDGTTQVGEIAISQPEVNGAGTHNDAFTKSQKAIYLTQFTPIVQVKYLIDKMFEQTSYTYTDDSVFNEAWFKKLYVDGIAEGSPSVPSGNGESYANTFAQTLPDSIDNQSEYPYPVVFPVVSQNNANAYNNATGIYTCPVNGNYSFVVELRGTLQAVAPNIGPLITLALFRNGSQVGTSQTEEQQIEGQDLAYDFSQSNPVPNAVTYTGAFNAGDQVQAVITDADGFRFGSIASGNFQCTATPQQIAVNDLLKTDLKIIDWFKSILTKFRLVMVPLVSDPSQFTVKPWEDYIASGELYDWTYKLDRKKDTKLEPLFYNQTADITFADQEDIDVINSYQQDTFGQVYGLRQYVSNNELLSGSKEIGTEFAPTPVAQIEGTFGLETRFIIPKFYENGDETTDHGHLQHQPITPVQRLLFWNGLQSTQTIQGNGTPTEVTWYYWDNLTTKNSGQAPLLRNGLKRYPRASYLSEIPTTSTSLNLNWNKQFAYFQYPNDPDAGTQGEDVYQRYWRQYILDVYSSRARKMTAYFNLDSEDMRNLTFDDVIFIKDSYWRILKVVDAPLGEISTIKVELIKLLDYRPTITVSGGGGGASSGSGAGVTPTPTEPVGEGSGPTPTPTPTEPTPTPTPTPIPVENPCTSYTVTNTTGLGPIVQFTYTDCESDSPSSVNVGPDGYVTVCSLTYPEITQSPEYADITVDGACQ